MDRCVDHLLFYMPRLSRTAGSAWERQFAANMARRARWKNWTPTQKQLEAMQGMVADMFASDDAALDLIDTGDRHDAA
ncbi:hypothetical protein [Tritonibacter mobilis]|uniref:hypothetical protein n=1 Tax=Tritonibacter mobilis TaxID=379347 RepID=UPI00080695E1|nr:hypothetical protein [Tritonibacter mobilis]